MISIQKYDERFWPDICMIHDAARKIELQYASLTDAFLPLEKIANAEGLFDYTHVDLALIGGRARILC